MTCLVRDKMRRHKICRGLLASTKVSISVVLWYLRLCQGMTINNNNDKGEVFWGISDGEGR